MSEGYLFWSLVALIFLMLELFLPASFVFFFLSLAACLTSFLSVFQLVNFSNSFPAFLAISILVFFLFYKKWSSQWGGKQKDLINNKTFDALIGQKAEIENIEGSFFILKIGKHFWRAYRHKDDEDLKKGDMVIVSGYKEMHLLIKKVVDTTDRSAV